MHNLKISHEELQRQYSSSFYKEETKQKAAANEVAFALVT